MTDKEIKEVLGRGTPSTFSLDPNIKDGITRSTLEAINHAKQFLRHQLADRLQLFHTPDLHFEAAIPASLGAKAPQILKRMRRGRPKSEKNSVS